MTIIPLPTTIEPRPGTWVAKPSLTLSAEGPGADRVAEYAREALSARSVGGHEVRRTSETTADLVLVVDPRGPVTNSEGYRLVVADSGVRIEASAAAGVFYGIQTLLQLLANGRRVDGQGVDGQGVDGQGVDGQGVDGQGIVGCQSIDDMPRYGWRGMHLDVGRHFFDVPFIKRFLDLLALHKFNTFHWHLTEDQGWRLESSRYPKLAEISAWRLESGQRYGGCYSADDVREVVQYASDRFIEVVPEIELPGHSVAALAAYPEFSCTGGPFAVETTWGVFDDVYCAGNDTVFEFLENILDDVLQSFPSPYIHVGGDECPKTRWKACPRCQARMRDERLADEEALQSWFIRRIAKFLTHRGRKVIGWDEILEGGLAPGVTVASWRGNEGGIEAARLGHDVIMSPTSHCYFDYRQRDHPDEPGTKQVLPLETVYALEPTPEALTDDEARHVLGAQGNVWTERMPIPQHVEYMVIPRICALSEVVWSPASGRDWPNFLQRLRPLVEWLESRGYHYRPLLD